MFAVPVLTYLLAKKEITLEEVISNAGTLLGAGIDTVSTCQLASIQALSSKQRFVSENILLVKSELINMTQEWDKEKF